MTSDIIGKIQSMTRDIIEENTFTSLNGGDLCVREVVKAEGDSSVPNLFQSDILQLTIVSKV